MRHGKNVSHYMSLNKILTRFKMLGDVRVRDYGDFLATVPRHSILAAK